MSDLSTTNNTEGMISIHWNEEDPVTDKDFPNIQEYIPNVDDPYWPTDNTPASCQSDVEEVTSDG